MRKIIWISLFVCMNTFFLGSESVRAQEDQSRRMGEVIITASKIEEDVRETGSSVVVITREEIESKRYATVLEAIKRKTGISSSSFGPLGGGSDVYLRGANASHTLVMIDGIRMYDAITADADYDMAHLPIDNVERIEIIKGPQSSLYGSDAMGGVINIITKKGKGAPSFFVSSETGFQDTYTETLGGQGSVRGLNYSFDISRQDSDGFTKARGGKEEDDYQKSSYNAKMSYQVNDGLEVGVQGLYLYARQGIDDGANQDDPNRIFRFENSLASVFANNQVKNFWDQKFQYSWFRNVRWDSDDPDEVDTTELNRSIFKGWLQEVDWQHDINVGELLAFGERVEDIVTMGFQYSHESGRSTSASGSNTAFSRSNDAGYYVQNKIGLDDKMFLTLALRTDDHSRFGLHTTGRATFSYLFDTQTRLKGSYGSGFNAPSLFQLFSDFGDDLLSAETSWGYDIGVEQDLFDKKLSISSVFFLQRFKDLIEFDSSAANPKQSDGDGRYVNRGAARTSGIESELEYQPFDNFSLKYGFTYLEAMDLAGQKHLRKRPNLKHNINLNLGLWDKFNWSVDVTRNIKIFDNPRLKDYTVVDMAFTYALSENVETFLKIDNIFNEIYQEVKGFANLPRFVHGGAKVTF